MTPAERASLRSSYQYQCGYCGVSEMDAGAELTVDHFQPRSRGGEHYAENWVYCCHACNEFKGDHWNPRSKHRILHPQRDNLADHIVEREDGLVMGITVTGSFHIEWLRLNRPAQVSHRRERKLLDLARQRRQELLTQVALLEDRVRLLADRLERMRRLTEP